MSSIFFEITDQKTVNVEIPVPSIWMRETPTCTTILSVPNKKEAVSVTVFKGNDYASIMPVEVRVAYHLDMTPACHDEFIHFFDTATARLKKMAENIAVPVLESSAHEEH